ncbi:hypothetical protein ACWEPL_52765 [Nonomuraea sp. NPDC004186]
MGGAPKFEEPQTLPDVSYAGFARSLDLEGIEVEKPEAIGPAWDRALAADRPVVLDGHCDPDIPPIPPHTDFEQLKDVAEAIIKRVPRSEPISPAADRTADGAQDEQDHADDEQDGADRVEQRDAEQPSQEQQDDADDDHVLTDPDTLILSKTRLPEVYAVNVHGAVPGSRTNSGSASARTGHRPPAGRPRRGLQGAVDDHGLHGSGPLRWTS